MIRAAIFDLDETLLDSSALAGARRRREWKRVFPRLDSVEEFEVGAEEPPVASLPEEARKRGLAVGLLTQSPKRYAEELARRFGIGVQKTVSGSEGLPEKPDPSGLISLARALAVAPRECIYVGDGVEDFGAAAAAGAVSVGVSWSTQTPRAWRHGWPDIAIERPSRLIELLEEGGKMGPLGEVAARDLEPTVHWGSLLRLGASTYGLGRYFPTGDRRHLHHPLSHLILDCKEDEAARARLAGVFATLHRVPTKLPPQLIASVPPEPGGEERFAAARAQLAELYGARDGEGLLRQLFAVEDYKHTARSARAEKVRDRFEATERLAGERVILLDDVITSGAQAEACRAALTEAGAGAVTIVAASVTQDSLPELCPACGEEYGGTIRTIRRRSDGKEFQGCSRWRQGCRWARNA
ncbi:MAG TPA: HAD-IA family hydrolase [Solirubrobacterales bacterium]|nr:HAD-IA family hydrolase [Solirubrobacterales bacterium]